MQNPNKQRIATSLLFLIFILLNAFISQAQNEGGFGSSLDFSPNQKTPTDSSLHLLSPRKAALWAFVPGGGTIYNKQYLKTPFVLGSIFGLTAFTIKRRQNYNTQYQAYATLLNGYSGLPINAIEFQVVRDAKRKALRDYNFALNGIFVLYGLSIAEAYLSTQIINDDHAHSPIKAAYYSGLLPGLGQIYNKKIWKVPFVYGGFAAGGYAIYYYARRTQIFTAEYLARTRPGWGEIDSRLRGYSSSSSLLTARRSSQKNLQIAIMGTIGWYLVNIIDSFIDAHLLDFDVSDDLSLQLYPTLLPTTNGQQGLGLSWQLAF